MANHYRDRETASASKEKITSAIHQVEEKIGEFAETAEQAMKSGEKQVRQAVSKFDKKLHENPWPTVAGIAAASLLLGFILGRK